VPSFVGAIILRKVAGVKEKEGNSLPRSMLLTEAIEIGPKRMSGEVLLPQAGCKEVDLDGRMGINALQHVHQVDIWGSTSCKRHDASKLCTMPT
jgi:hypothetical protein